MQNQGRSDTDGYQAVANNAAELAAKGGKSHRFRITRKKRTANYNKKTRIKK